MFNRFPGADFNKINLDWIMRTLKKLAPAADMIEQSAAALERAQQTAEQAQQTANAAAAAVETVTANAAAAVTTANEAKEIAQQAASATIADGSVTRVKLSSDVADDIDGAAADAAAALAAANVAQQIGTQAQQSATAAGNDASLALVNAENARQAAVSAQGTADTARTAAAAAQATADQALAAAGSVSAWSLLATLNNGDGTNRNQLLPSATKEVLLVVYDYISSSRRTSLYMPAGAFPSSGQTGYWTVTVAGVQKDMYVYYNAGVVIQTDTANMVAEIYYR